MRRLLVTVAALALGVAVAAPALAAPPTIDATVDQASPRFGDGLAYVVTANVDGPLVDSARIVSDVRPFTRLAPPVERRSVTNGVGHITVTQSIACLVASCLEAKGGAVALPQARVSAGGATATASRVELTVRRRVSAAAVNASEPAFRRPEALPGPTYRVSPSAAALALVALGAGLLALGAVVLTGPLRQTRSERRRALAVDERERAVRLLRESVTRDAADRRRAASLAARVVAEPELARTAAGVAWSRPEPGPPDATTLADRVEHEPAGRV